jgi:hypothetical protein
MMLDCLCADQRLVVKLNCMVREYLTLVGGGGERPPTIGACTDRLTETLMMVQHGGFNLNELLGAALTDVQGLLESVYEERRSC